MVAWGVPVLGVVPDGQASLRQAVAATWPGVPQQICHFHALREAGRVLYARARAIKAQLRTALQTRIRKVRQPVERHLLTAGPADASYARLLCMPPMHASYARLLCTPPGGLCGRHSGAY
jgi:hypothetical protein